MLIVVLKIHPVVKKRDVILPRMLVASELRKHIIPLAALHVCMFFRTCRLDEKQDRFMQLADRQMPAQRPACLQRMQHTCVLRREWDDDDRFLFVVGQPRLCQRREGQRAMAYTVPPCTASRCKSLLSACRYANHGTYIHTYGTAEWGAD